MERILQNTCVNENLPHKEMPSSPKNKGQFHATIKKPKPSKIKVHIIYPNSDTIELWKFSNLTFGGYLAGTAPMPSVRSSSSLLCRFCLEHARTVQHTDSFWHHQLAPFMGKKTVTTILPLSRQRVVWYSLAR